MSLAFVVRQHVVNGIDNLDSLALGEAQKPQLKRQSKQHHGYKLHMQNVGLAAGETRGQYTQVEKTLGSLEDAPQRSWNALQPGNDIEAWSSAQAHALEAIRVQIVADGANLELNIRAVVQRLAQMPGVIRNDREQVHHENTRGRFHAAGGLPRQRRCDLNWGRAWQALCPHQSRPRKLSRRGRRRRLPFGRDRKST